MSERDLHERASAVFLELRPLAPDERRRRLEAVRLEDELLGREVQSLMAHDVQENETSAGDTPEGTTGEVPGTHPARIGPYTVVGRIGRGGSGIVFLADQHEPVRRRVAIKIVPYAAVNPEVAARFEFERRALERTEHPNITRILDAGRTVDGLPYLVMDFVRGSPITAYCRERGVGLRERIALMMQVADAVQHAHQRGLIHRDLKPGNILVSEADGQPTPRILDFGIAKPTPGVLEEVSPPTAGGPVGTPAYMAPEQTGGQAVDTRADVYALGAVLYELAAGRPPVDTGGDFVQAMRNVRDAVPPPASRVRAKTAAMFAPDAPPRSLLLDLDCILGRALEKDPARRYPTAAAFSEDLRRLLGREPIAARAPTVAYRLSRFVQRNRAVSALLAVALLALVAGIAASTAALIEANRQGREAANQADAQREINRFLTDDLLAASSPDQEGQNITALELLNRAARKVDLRFAGRPLIAAAIHHTLGTAYTELGAFDEADHHLQRAISLRREAAGPDAPDTVRSEIAAAGLLGHRERVEEARAALMKVIPRARLILGAEDPALYAALNDLGVMYEAMDKGAEAVELLQEALAGRARLLGPRDPHVLITTSNLAQALDRLGQTERSLGLMIEALRIAESLPDQPRMTVLGLCNNIGATYQDLNQPEAAAPYLRRAASLAADWLGPESPGTLTIQANLAGLEAKLGDPGRAAELYDAVVKARTRTLGPAAFDTLASRYGYWDCLRIAERYGEAAAGLAALLPEVEGSLGEKHWLATQTRATLARTLLDGGRAAEALPYAERAAGEFVALYGPDHARSRTTTALLESIRARLGGESPR